MGEKLHLLVLFALTQAVLGQYASPYASSFIPVGSWGSVPASSSSVSRSPVATTATRQTTTGMSPLAPPIGSPAATRAQAAPQRLQPMAPPIGSPITMPQRQPLTPTRQPPTAAPATPPPATVGRPGNIFTAMEQSNRPPQHDSSKRPNVFEMTSVDPQRNQNSPPLPPLSRPGTVFDSLQPATPPANQPTVASSTPQKLPSSPPLPPASRPGTVFDSPRPATPPASQPATAPSTPPRLPSSPPLPPASRPGTIFDSPRPATPPASQPTTAPSTPQQLPSHPPLPPSTRPGTIFDSMPPSRPSTPKSDPSPATNPIPAGPKKPNLLETTTPVRPSSPQPVEDHAHEDDDYQLPEGWDDPNHPNYIDLDELFGEEHPIDEEMDELDVILDSLPEGWHDPNHPNYVDLEQLLAYLFPEDFAPNNGSSAPQHGPNNNQVPGPHSSLPPQPEGSNPRPGQPGIPNNLPHQPQTSNPSSTPGTRPPQPSEPHNPNLPSNQSGMNHPNNPYLPSQPGQTSNPGSVSPSTPNDEFEDFLNSLPEGWYDPNHPNYIDIDKLFDDMYPYQEEYAQETYPQPSRTAQPMQPGTISPNFPPQQPQPMNQFPASNPRPSQPVQPGMNTPSTPYIPPQQPQSSNQFPASNPRPPQPVQPGMNNPSTPYIPPQQPQPMNQFPAPNPRPSQPVQPGMNNPSTPYIPPQQPQPSNQFPAPNPRPSQPVQPGMNNPSTPYIPPQQPQPMNQFPAPNPRPSQPVQPGMNNPSTPYIPPQQPQPSNQFPAPNPRPSQPVQPGMTNPSTPYIPPQQPQPSNQFPAPNPRPSQPVQPGMNSPSTPYIPPQQSQPSNQFPASNPRPSQPVQPGMNSPSTPYIPPQQPQPSNQFPASNPHPSQPVQPGRDDPNNPPIPSQPTPPIQSVDPYDQPNQPGMGSPNSPLVPSHDDLTNHLPPPFSDDMDDFMANLPEGWYDPNHPNYIDIDKYFDSLYQDEPYEPEDNYLPPQKSEQSNELAPTDGFDDFMATLPEGWHDPNHPNYIDVDKFFDDHYPEDATNEEPPEDRFSSPTQSFPTVDPNDREFLSDSENPTFNEGDDLDEFMASLPEGWHDPNHPNYIDVDNYFNNSNLNDPIDENENIPEGDEYLPPNHNEESVHHPDDFDEFMASLPEGWHDPNHPNYIDVDSYFDNANLNDPIDESENIPEEDYLPFDQHEEGGHPPDDLDEFMASLPEGWHDPNHPNYIDIDKYFNDLHSSDPFENEYPISDYPLDDEYPLDSEDTTSDQIRHSNNYDPNQDWYDSYPYDPNYPYDPHYDDSEWNTYESQVEFEDILRLRRLSDAYVKNKEVEQRTKVPSKQVSSPDKNKIYNTKDPAMRNVLMKNFLNAKKETLLQEKQTESKTIDDSKMRELLKKKLMEANKASLPPEKSFAETNERQLKTIVTNNPNSAVNVKDPRVRQEVLKKIMAEKEEKSANVPKAIEKISESANSAEKARKALTYKMAVEKMKSTESQNGATKSEKQLAEVLKHQKLVDIARLNQKSDTSTTQDNLKLKEAAIRKLIADREKVQSNLANRDGIEKTQSEELLKRNFVGGKDQKDVNISNEVPKTMQGSGTSMEKLRVNEATMRKIMDERRKLQASQADSEVIEKSQRSEEESNGAKIREAILKKMAVENGIYPKISAQNGPITTGKSLSEELLERKLVGNVDEKKVVTSEASKTPQRSDTSTMSGSPRVKEAIMRKMVEKARKLADTKTL